MPVQTNSPNEPVKPILIVDDEEIVLVALRDTLLREGYSVVASPHAIHALSVLRGQQFSVVITDQQMPMVTGLEFLAQVREIQPDATRILITAVLSLSTVIDAINKGEIYRFIVKPWLREELLATVKNAVQRHDLISKNARLQAETQAMNAQLTELNQRPRSPSRPRRRTKRPIAAIRPQPGGKSPPLRRTVRPDHAHLLSHPRQPGPPRFRTLRRHGRRRRPLPGPKTIPRNQRLHLRHRPRRHPAPSHQTVAGFPPNSHRRRVGLDPSAPHFGPGTRRLHPPPPPPLAPPFAATTNALTAPAIPTVSVATAYPGWRVCSPLPWPTPRAIWTPAKPPK